MFSAISSRLGYPAASSSTNNLSPDSNEPPPFPLPDSIQRSKPSSAPTPSFSFNTPDEDEPEEDEYGSDNDFRLPEIPGEKLVAPTSTTKLAKKPRKKVMIEKGYSQLDWGRLKSSGADLRGGVTQLQRITPEELAKHKSKDDCWQAYQGKVYNVTPFLKYHPGGVPELMRAAGKDGTELFMKTHAWVNVDLMMEGTLVGFLVRD